ncbi:MAG: hypothetical protein RR687_14160, partial [Comamonas sp.]
MTLFEISCVIDLKREVPGVHRCICHGIVTSFCFANPVEALAVGREAETALIRLRCGSMSE